MAFKDKLNKLSENMDKAADPRSPEGQLVQKGSNFADQSIADDSRARDLANTMVDSLASVSAGGGGTPLDDLERAATSATRSSAHIVVAVTTLASQEAKSIGSRTMQYGPTVLSALLGIGALRHWARKHGTDVATYEAEDFASKGGVQQIIFNEDIKADFEVLKISKTSEIAETTIHRDLLSRRSLDSLKLHPSFETVNSEDAKNEYIRSIKEITDVHAARICKALETFDSKELGSIHLGQKDGQMSFGDLTGTNVLDAFTKNYGQAFKEYRETIDNIFNSSATADIKEARAREAGDVLLARIYEPLVNNGKDVFVNAGESITLFESKDAHVSKKDNLITGTLASYQKKLSESQTLSQEHVQDLKPFFEDSISKKEGLLKDKTTELEAMINEYASKDDTLVLENEIFGLKNSIQSDKSALKLLNNEALTESDLSYLQTDSVTTKNVLNEINGASNPSAKMQVKLLQDFKVDIYKVSNQIDQESAPLVDKMKTSLGLNGASHVGVDKNEYNEALAQMSDCWARGSQNLQAVVAKHTDFAHSLETSVQFDNVAAAEKFKESFDAALKAKFPQLFDGAGKCKITETVAYGNDPKHQAAKVYVYPQMINSAEMRAKVEEFLKEFKDNDNRFDYFNGPLVGMTPKSIKAIQRELQKTYKESGVEHPVSIYAEINKDSKLKDGVIRLEAGAGYLEGVNALAGYGSFEATTDIRPGEVPVEKLQAFVSKHQGNPNVNMSLTARTISREDVDRFGGLNNLRNYLNSQTSQVENRTGREAVSYALSQEDNGAVKVWCTSTYSNWIEKQLLNKGLLHKMPGVSDKVVEPDVGIS